MPLDKIINYAAPLASAESKPHDYTEFINGVGVFCGSHIPAHFPEHSHPEIQVIVPFEGTRCVARWHTDTGRTVTRRVHEWHTCVTASEQPHGSDWLKNAEMVIFYLAPSFAKAAAQDLIKSSNFEIIGNNLTEDRLIQQLAQTVRAEFKITNHFEPLYLESIANVLTWHLIRNYAAQGNSLTEVQRGLAPRQLQQTIEYFNQHLNEKLSLAAVARAVGMSPFHFARSFKIATGSSPYQYLLNERLALAKTLLAQPDLSITEIASQVGCVNQSHFSTLFRRIVGTSPKNYRQNL